MHGLWPVVSTDTWIALEIRFGDEHMHFKVIRAAIEEVPRFFGNCMDNRVAISSTDLASFTTGNVWS